MTGDLRTRVEALAARIKREAQLLGGCHPIDKGARRNIGIDADRLAALALDADPDAPAADRTIASVTDHDATPIGPAMIPPTADAGDPCPKHRARGVNPECPDCDQPPTADAPADTDLRMDMREAVYYCLTDASMWIGDDGQPLDYLPAREALIGEFLDEAVDALLPLVRAQVEAARRDALNEAADEWPAYQLKPSECRDLLRGRAARGETRQP